MKFYRDNCAVRIHYECEVFGGLIAYDRVHLARWSQQFSPTKS